MKLPSRRELPDYYDIIKKPLDIKKIVNRIEEGKVSYVNCDMLAHRNEHCNDERLIFFIRYKVEQKSVLAISDSVYVLEPIDIYNIERV